MGRLNPHASRRASESYDNFFDSLTLVLPTPHTFPDGTEVIELLGFDGITATGAGRAPAVATTSSQPAPPPYALFPFDPLGGLDVTFGDSSKPVSSTVNRDEYLLTMSVVRTYIPYLPELVRAAEQDIIRMLSVSLDANASGKASSASAAISATLSTSNSTRGISTNGPTGGSAQAITSYHRSLFLNAVPVQTSRDTLSWAWALAPDLTLDYVSEPVHALAAAAGAATGDVTAAHAAAERARTELQASVSLQAILAADGEGKQVLLQDDLLVQCDSARALIEMDSPPVYSQPEVAAIFTDCACIALHLLSAGSLWAPLLPPRADLSYLRLRTIAPRRTYASGDPRNVLQLFIHQIRRVGFVSSGDSEPRSPRAVEVLAATAELFVGIVGLTQVPRYFHSAQLCLQS